MITDNLQKHSPEDLALKLEKIETMKWLLNLEDSDIDVSEEELQNKIDNIACKNYLKLFVIKQYYDLIPNTMRACINNIIASNNDKIKYKSCLNLFKKKFQTNQEFIELDQYISLSIAHGVIHNLDKKDLCNEELQIDLLFESKQSYLILLFNIIYDSCNDIVKFDQSEIIYNFPLLSYWINQNKSKPIEDLTYDDCEVIAGLIYELDYDKILELNLSSSSKKYEAINKIINSLPAKFHVNNITQALFRIFILKPFIWSYQSHEEIAASIKGLPNVL